MTVTFRVPQSYPLMFFSELSHLPDPIPDGHVTIEGEVVEGTWSAVRSISTNSQEYQGPHQMR